MGVAEQQVLFPVLCMVLIHLFFGIDSNHQSNTISLTCRGLETRFKSGSHMGALSSRVLVALTEEPLLRGRKDKDLTSDGVDEVVELPLEDI